MATVTQRVLRHYHGYLRYAAVLPAGWTGLTVVACGQRLQNRCTGWTPLPAVVIVIPVPVTAASPLPLLQRVSVSHSVQRTVVQYRLLWQTAATTPRTPDVVTPVTPPLT